MESWRKACMLGSKRPNQKEGTTWLPQSSTYPKSESVAVWTAGLLYQTQNTLPKTHKSHFTIFTLEYDLTAVFKYRNQILKSGRCSLPSDGGTYLDWPVMWPLLTGRGGRARGSEFPTGASSQTHAQRQASKLKDTMETAGYTTVSYTV